MTLLTWHSQLLWISVSFNSCLTTHFPRPSHSYNTFKWRANPYCHAFDYSDKIQKDVRSWWTLQVTCNTWTAVDLFERHDREMFMGTGGFWRWILWFRCTKWFYHSSLARAEERQPTNSWHYWESYDIDGVASSSSSFSSRWVRMSWSFGLFLLTYIQELPMSLCFHLTKVTITIVLQMKLGIVCPEGSEARELKAGLNQHGEVIACAGCF